MRVAALLLALALGGHAIAGEPVTVVESTDYTGTSLYPEVIDFVDQVARTSDVVSVARLATTAEGRIVPLVILSKERVRTPAELRVSARPPVALLVANQE